MNVEKHVKVNMVWFNRSVITLAIALIEFSVSVLEDVEKHEWSKHVYTLPRDDKLGDCPYVSIVGMSSSGEIVFCKDYTSKPYYVFYFNPERNTLQCVEIQGFGEYYESNERHKVDIFVDNNVEDLGVNDAKYFKSSHVLS
ncbi:unnamed protein product [Cochlearia groenlandica]